MGGGIEDLRRLLVSHFRLEVPIYTYLYACECASRAIILQFASARKAALSVLASLSFFRRLLYTPPRV